MNPTDGSPSEERLARLLAAYEEGLRAGAPTGPAATAEPDGLSPAERELLRANQEVVWLLRGVAGSAQETRGLTDTPPAGPQEHPLRTNELRCPAVRPGLVRSFVGEGPEQRPSPGSGKARLVAEVDRLGVAAVGEVLALVRAYGLEVVGAAVEFLKD
jgi:hypothetical protein